MLITGSLTGRDFRVVAQVAPFVLYDLVPPECYKAWLALSHLIPIVWQPSIRNVGEHLVSCTMLLSAFKFTPLPCAD